MSQVPQKVQSSGYVAELQKLTSMKLLNHKLPTLYAPTKHGELRKRDVTGRLLLFHRTMWPLITMSTGLKLTGFLLTWPGWCISCPTSDEPTYLRVMWGSGVYQAVV